MKILKVLLTLSGLVLSGGLYASVDTVYFNSNWQRVNTREKMSFYRLPVVKTADSGYRVIDCYKDGQVQMLAYALNENCSIYNGYRIAYYPSGKMKTEGNITKGMRNGVWKGYRTGGQLQRTTTYWNDELNGLMTGYDSLGNKRYEEEYKDGYLNGRLIQYYPGKEKVYVKEHFKNGKPDSARLVYYENGALKREEAYLQDKRKYKGQCYDVRGGKLKYFPFAEGPKPLREDFLKSAYNSMKAMKDIFSDKVYLSFVVDKQGSVEDVEIEKKDEGLVSEETKEAIRIRIGKWTGGKFDGVPVKWKFYFAMDMSDGGYYNTKLQAAHENIID